MGRSTFKRLLSGFLAVALMLPTGLVLSTPVLAAEQPAPTASTVEMADMSLEDYIQAAYGLTKPATPVWTQDFRSALSTTWSTQNTTASNFTLDTDAGTYAIAGNTAGYKAKHTGDTFTNFVYEGNVRLNSSTYTGNRSAGLLFRLSTATGNNYWGSSVNQLTGYYASIRSDGSFALQRFGSNAVTELAWLQTDLPGDATQSAATYRMKVVCVDSNIDVWVNDQHVASVNDTSLLTAGHVGIRTVSNSSVTRMGVFSDLKVYDLGTAYVSPRLTYNWSGVRGAVFVPTNATGQLEMWDNYDSAINARELTYAKFYGINWVRVYLSSLVYNKDPERFLANFEDFLSLAAARGIKVQPILFDDCHYWNAEEYFPSDGVYPPPRYGEHNSRWVQDPGNNGKDRYFSKTNSSKPGLKAYVKGVVEAHKDDPRIALWTLYNEPGMTQTNEDYEDMTIQIINDCRVWVKETGTQTPVTATTADGGSFFGAPYSDVITYHPYDASVTQSIAVNGQTFNQTVAVGNASKTKTILVDECMNRQDQTLSTIMSRLGPYGFVVWELGIGRDNCRFPWDPDLTYEPAVPFHGLIYPDGHPWSLSEINTLKGSLPQDAFSVDYFKDNTFTNLAKSSITPMIDFDLGDERGTGSPDGSAGIDKDRFSTRWKGTVKADYSETYTFFADSDGFVSVTVDGQKVIDKQSWNRREAKGNISLTAGEEYDIVVEYIHNTGDASLHLNWSSASLAKTVVRPVASTAVLVESIAFSSGTVTMEPGQTTTIPVVFTPDNTTDKRVTWTRTSGSNSIATVNADTGVITAVGVGTAVFQATTAVGGKTATVTVEVKASGQTDGGGRTFMNPIAAVGSQDPGVTYHNGWYYYVKEDGEITIQMSRTRRLQDIGTAPRKTIFAGGPNSGGVNPSGWGGHGWSDDMWAPEVFYLKDPLDNQYHWYLYFSANDEANMDAMRQWVSKHEAIPGKETEFDPENPMTGRFGTPSRLYPTTSNQDLWAIDGTVLEYNGELYLLWSGAQSSSNGDQEIFIAKMDGPMKLTGSRTKLSTVDQSWEMIDTDEGQDVPWVNEGPQLMYRNGKIWCVYSANGSWGKNYCLGLLEFTGTNPLTASHWTKKKDAPVFLGVSTAYGPGHNILVPSPDGTEVWNVYHANQSNNAPGGWWAGRSVRAQKVNFSGANVPDFGVPVKAYIKTSPGDTIVEPSGTPDILKISVEAETGTTSGTVAFDTGANHNSGASYARIFTYDANMATNSLTLTVNAPYAGEYSLAAVMSGGSTGTTGLKTPGRLRMSVNDAASVIIEAPNRGADMPTSNSGRALYDRWSIAAPDGYFSGSNDDANPTGRIGREHEIKVNLNQGANTFVFAGASATNHLAGLDAIHLYYNGTVAVESIEITKQPPATMKVGAKATVEALVKPDAAANKEFEWQSGDNAVLTVDATGEVTAVGVGKATVAAVSKENAAIKAQTIEVTVIEDVLPASIALNKTTLGMDVGEEVKLTATILPNDPGVDKTVTWESSAPDIAAVDTLGNVYSKKAGSAVITATTVNGLKATCNVTVIKQIPPESIGLNKTTLSMIVDEEEQLTATVLPDDPGVDKTVTWESSDATVAAVDTSGKVSAKKAGSATITAATVNGKTAACAVTVKKTPTGITLNKTKLSMSVDDEEQLVATVLPENDSDVVQTVEWESSDTDVAEVDASGKVSAIAVGSATITVTTVNGKKATCAVMVMGDDAPTGITLDETTVSIRVDEAAQLVATVLPDDDPGINRTVTWESDDTDVAEVDASGNVSAIAEGSATITAATVNGFEATCDVTVIPALVKETTPDAAIDYIDEVLTGLEIGGTYAFNAAANVTLTDTYVPIDSSWFGNRVVIVKRGDGLTLADSDAFELDIPARPAAPLLDKTNCTNESNDDGTITGVNSDMEYSADDGMSWMPVDGSEITGLAPGDYSVRVAAQAGVSFKSLDTYVTVGDYEAPATHTITAFAGDGGRVSPSGLVTVNEGADQPFTITADKKYSIEDVLVDGESVGAVTSYTFYAVTSGHTIEARFSRDVEPPVTHTIIATAGAGGSISPSGNVMVNDRADQRFTITADDQYSLSDVLVDGVSVGAVTSYNFPSVTGGHTIEARFTRDSDPTPNPSRPGSNNGSRPGSGQKPKPKPEPEPESEPLPSDKIETPDLIISDDTVRVDLTEDKHVFSEDASKEMVKQSKDKAIFIKGNGVDVVIPRNALADGTDVNDLIVDTTKSGNVVQVTHTDGSVSILPFAVVEQGKRVVYIAMAAGKYELTTNSKSFPDIRAHWGEADIVFTAARDIFAGDEQGNFNPDQVMNRAMMAMILWRMAGSQTAGGARFADVNADDWFYEAAAWIGETGLMVGDSTRFDPLAPITREQLATVLVRFAAYYELNLHEKSALGDAAAGGFMDADQVSDWAKSAVKNAVNAELIVGLPGGNIDPQGHATRAQVAAVLARYIRNVLQVDA